MIANYPPYEKKIEHNGKEVTVHLWKNEEIGQLEDYPMYHITSEGRVFSWYVGRFLRYRFDDQKKTKDGNMKVYVRYSLQSKYADRKPDEILAHVLVWKLFGGYPIPKDSVVHHISGDSLDNRLINLQVMTKEEHDKIAGGFQLGVERKVVDSGTFARGGHDFPFTKMKYFERRDDAAKYLNMDMKEFETFLKREPEEIFCEDIKAWHAPDGRIVLKFKKKYSKKEDMIYYEI